MDRSALLRELETDIAALLDQTGDLDDRALQFDGTDEGKLFIEAWKRARIIVDSGSGHSTPAPRACPDAHCRNLRVAYEVKLSARATAFRIALDLLTVS